LVFDFNKIITIVACGSWVLTGVNTTRHHDGKGDKVSNNLVNDVTDTILTGIRADSWVEHDFSVLKVDFDIKNWGKSILSVVSNAELILKEEH